MASWTSVTFSSLKSWFSGSPIHSYFNKFYSCRNGLELRTAISNTMSVVDQALTSLSIRMIRWLVDSMSNSPLTPGLAPPTTPWSCWSTSWSTSAGRKTSRRISSTLPLTQPMPQLTQVTHHKVGCEGDENIIPGKKFSKKSQRGTFYGDALMEIDWAVGQILEYVTKKKRLDKNFKNCLFYHLFFGSFQHKTNFSDFYFR